MNQHSMGALLRGAYMGTLAAVVLACSPTIDTGSSPQPDRERASETLTPATPSSDPAAALKAGFANPPHAAKPWVYWW